MRRTKFILTAITTLALGEAVALADHNAHAAVDTPVVIEARVGAMPPSDPTMDEIRAEFEEQGFAAKRPSIERVIGGRMPYPGIEDPGLAPASLLQSLDAGFEAYRFADPKAQSLLSDALEAVRRNPSLLASDTKNLDTIHRAMSALALLQKRLKHPADEEALLAELNRAFPTRSLSRDDFGPDDIADYKAVVKKANQLPHGQLLVDVDQAEVVLFVDGQMRGMGKAELENQLPGAYGVLVRAPSRTDVGRKYLVDVIGGGESSLKIHWAVDSSFWVVGTSVGLTFPTESARTHDQPSFAAEVANWTPRGQVVVLDRVAEGGKTVLEATVYRSDRTVLGQQRVVLDGDVRAKARELARALHEGLPKGSAPPRRAASAPAQVASPRAPSSEESDVDLAPYFAIGGLAILAGGAATYGVAYERAEQPQRGLKLAGLGGFGIGAVALGVGLYQQGRSWGYDETTSALFGAGMAAFAAGGMMFIIGGDDAPPLSSRAAFISGASGLVIGAGALGLSLYRTSDYPIAPVVAPHHDGAVVGVAGSF